MSKILCRKKIKFQEYGPTKVTNYQVNPLSKGEDNKIIRTKNLNDSGLQIQHRPKDYIFYVWQFSINLPCSGTYDYHHERLLNTVMMKRLFLLKLPRFQSPNRTSRPSIPAHVRPCSVYYRARILIQTRDISSYQLDICRSRTYCHRETSCSFLLVHRPTFVLLFCWYTRLFFQFLFPWLSTPRAMRIMA